MSDVSACPVCRNAEGDSCREISLTDGAHSEFECVACGSYRASDTVLATTLQAEREDLTSVQRALVSHRLRTRSPAEEPFMVTSEWLDHLLSNGSLPSPAVQAANLVRFVGDDVARSGEPIAQLPIGIYAIIGALNRNAVIRLTKELVERQILTADPLGTAVSTDPATGHPR